MSPLECKLQGKKTLISLHMCLQRMEQDLAQSSYFFIKNSKYKTHSENSKKPDNMGRL